MTKQETIELLDKLEPGGPQRPDGGNRYGGQTEARYRHPARTNSSSSRRCRRRSVPTWPSRSRKRRSTRPNKADPETENGTEDAAKAVVSRHADRLAISTRRLPAAEQAVSGGTDLPQEPLAAPQTGKSPKNSSSRIRSENWKSAELKTLAKETKVQYWQRANKDELTTLFTETDPAKIKAVQASIDTAA